MKLSEFGSLSTKLTQLPKSKFFAIAIVKPKNIINLGMIFRLAVNYKASTLFVVQAPFPYKRVPTDTFRTSTKLPVIWTDDLPNIVEVTKVWVDFNPNAIPLPKFKHPKNALYIFGGENQTLTPPDNAKVVYVPTVGCLNLAITVGTVLYDRVLKEEL